MISLFNSFSPGIVKVLPFPSRLELKVGSSTDYFRVELFTEPLMSKSEFGSALLFLNQKIFGYYLPFANCRRRSFQLRFFYSKLTCSWNFHRWAFICIASSTFRFKTSYRFLILQPTKHTRSISLTVRAIVVLVLTVFFHPLLLFLIFFCLSL